MDIYTEHHPHHEIGPIEHLKYVGAQYYTTLLSRLTSHIKNEDVHVSNEDRYKWDNKADKTALRELEMKMAELTPSSDKDDIDLSDYATRKWVENQNYATKGQYPTYEELNSRYALKTEIPSVANFATKVYVDDAIRNIKPGSSTDMSGYATKSDIYTLSQTDQFMAALILDLQDRIGVSSEGITMWVEITGSDAYYTFKIEKGSLTGVYRNTDSESLAAVGDMILRLNIQNGNSRAYRKTANGQGVAW